MKASDNLLEITRSRLEKNSFEGNKEKKCMRGNLFTKREFSYRLEKNIPVKKWSEIARNKVQLSCLRQFKFSSKPSLSSAAHVGHLAMFQF